jgi:excisionase family DNA binding protein
MTTWLDLDELAKHLKTPKSTLYKLVRAGTIPGHKVGRSYRFDRDEVDTAIRSGELIKSKKKGQR